MAESIKDELIDAIGFKPNPHSKWAGQVEAVACPPHLDVIARMALTNVAPDDLSLVAEGTLEGKSFGTDELAVHFEGRKVTITDRDSGITVGRSAFERLVARYLAAAINAATSSRHPVTSEPSWPGVVAAQAKLAKRGTTSS
jgi:hypothetical protein